ncbi:hypothetical protein [Georgenia satyanarayanai]|nr:hypothetical protein [Georgenia satyanarayanai]
MVLQRSDAEMAGHRTAERKAAADFEAALAEEPWVRALAHLGAVRKRAALTRHDQERAAAILGTTLTGKGTVPTSVAGYIDGSVVPEFLVRPVARAADSLAETIHEEERVQRAERARAEMADPDTLARYGQSSARPASPLARIQQDGAVETTHRTTPDGKRITVHRSLNTGASVTLDDDGNPYNVPQPEKVVMSQPPSWSTALR